MNPNQPSRRNVLAALCAALLGWLWPTKPAPACPPALVSASFPPLPSGASFYATNYCYDGTCMRIAGVDDAGRPFSAKSGYDFQGRLKYLWDSPVAGPTKGKKGSGII
jgi:hypothetical protein